MKRDAKQGNDAPLGYSQIAQEILTRIRGSRSQIEVSRLLGFRYNQYHKWESGHRQIKWDQFIQVCKTFQIQIHEALRRLLLFVEKDFESANASEVLSQLLKIHGHDDFEVLARRLHTHPSSIRRWLSGSVVPDLGTVLQIFDLERDFHPKSANIEEARLQFFSYFPWGLALLAGLEVEKFKDLKSDQFPELARLVGIPVNVLIKSLSVMVQLGIVELKQERYHLKLHFFNLSNLNQIDMQRPNQYWTEKVHSRLRILEQEGADRLPPKALYFSHYRMMSITKESLDQVNKAMAEFVGKLQAIHANQTGPREQVSCLLIHHYRPDLLPLDDDFDFNWMQNRHTLLENWMAQLENLDPEAVR